MQYQLAFILLAGLLSRVPKSSASSASFLALMSSIHYFLTSVSALAFFFLLFFFYFLSLWSFLSALFFLRLEVLDYLSCSGCNSSSNFTSASF